MQTEILLQSIIEQTKQHINKAERLKQVDLTLLKRKPSNDTWSILECLEHLNLYGDFYLPQIENKIKSSKSRHEASFKSGFLGNYFANSMRPKEKLNKMKTFKDKNPSNTSLNATVIDRFINQQVHFLELLSQSRNVNLSEVKITTSISNWIKIKLGDTFLFLNNHNIRHFAQIERIENMAITTPHRPLH